MKLKAYKHKKLADRLFALSDSTEQSNGKSAEMRTLVAEINNLLPELNLKNQRTNRELKLSAKLLEKNIANTKKNITKLKAAEENLTKIAKRTKSKPEIAII